MKPDLELMHTLLLENINDEVNLGEYTRQEIMHQKALLLKVRGNKSRHHLIQSRDLLNRQASWKKRY